MRNQEQQQPLTLKPKETQVIESAPEVPTV